jgi:hypothetical protein
MKQANSKAKGWKKWLRGGWLSLLTIPVVLVAWAGYAGYVSEHGMPMADNGDWSGQVLSTLHEGIVVGSPIPVANACGLGASSCFKCHNGKRAAKASEEVWHTEHAEVNHSCVGCHKGNERLMLERMAHKDLLTKSMDQAKEICGDCHTGDEAAGMIEKYQEVLTAKAEAAAADESSKTEEEAPAESGEEPAKAAEGATNE